MKNVAPERKCMQITNTNTNVSILYLFLCFPIFSLQDENFAKFKQSKLKRTNTINNPFSCNFCCAKTDIWCCAVLLCNPPPLSPPQERLRTKLVESGAFSRVWDDLLHSGSILFPVLKKNPEQNRFLLCVEPLSFSHC